MTGLWDRWRSSEAGTQARRTINAPRSVDGGDDRARFSRPRPALVPLSRGVGANLNAAWDFGCGRRDRSGGCHLRGTLVFGYGFNVETAGDHPVWHRSETDVFPGQVAPAGAAGPELGGDTEDPVT